MEAAPGASSEKPLGRQPLHSILQLPIQLHRTVKFRQSKYSVPPRDADYKYVTVPKLSPLAYLTGNITDWAEQNLIGGEATLYFENTFVGKSYLNVNQLKDTLTVSLGNDNSILVKREKRKDFTSTRVLGSNKTETYSFLITVRNNKTNPVQDNSK